MTKFMMIGFEPSKDKTALNIRITGMNPDEFKAVMLNKELLIAMILKHFSGEAANDPGGQPL